MRIFDHIHGYINICKNAKLIIDTPEFQRLRNIKQLGCVYFVFPSATHSRFEHSLGVYHLARRYMDTLNKKEIKYKPNEYKLISIAALIHDLGHGPFSHLFDAYVTRTNHEFRSIEIFKHMNDIYKWGYTGYEINFMYKVIYPEIMEKEDYQNKYLYQIVSNHNGIDVDRFDYMLRDLKMSGIENRYNIENEFIFHLMENSYIKHFNEIMFDERIKFHIEMFFSTRFSIYKKICNHKTVKSMELMMGEILRLLENTFHINKSIIDNNWERFCVFNDNIVYSLDFLSDKSKNNDIAFQLYKRIKERENYKLIEEYESYNSDELKDLQLIKYNNPKDYIVNRSMITYYSDESPKFIDTNDNIIYEDFFKDKGRNMYLIKVFKK